MTEREEQIRQAASFSNMVSNDFIRGAEWSDAHPAWRSVKNIENEPPKVGDSVLLVVKNKVWGKNAVREGYYGSDGYWHQLLPFGGNSIAFPSHWMPLPTPPNDDDQ